MASRQSTRRSPKKKSAAPVAEIDLFDAHLRVGLFEESARVDGEKRRLKKRLRSEAKKVLSKKAESTPTLWEPGRLPCVICGRQGLGFIRSIGGKLVAACTWEHLKMTNVAVDMTPAPRTVGQLRHEGLGLSEREAAMAGLRALLNFMDQKGFAVPVPTADGGVIQAQCFDFMDLEMATHAASVFFKTAAVNLADQAKNGHLIDDEIPFAGPGEEPAQHEFAHGRAIMKAAEGNSDA